MGKQSKKSPSTYERKLEICVDEIHARFGSFSATEVHEEMKKRGWLSPLDSMLDTHKLLTEMYGKPGDACG